MTIQNDIAASLGLKGKGSKARCDAFAVIAEQAYTAESGKAAFVATLAKALGETPDDAAIKLARDETAIGIAAMRMPVQEFGKGVKSADMASRLAIVRDWFHNYQAPTQAVAGSVPKVKKGKKGWRSAKVHRVIRNAEQRASKYLAELNHGDAQTDAADNAKRGNGKPSPHHGKQSKAAAPDAAKPSHAELVQPEKPLTQQNFAGQLVMMLATAQQYASKHAKVQPMEFNPVIEGLIALHKLALKADAEFNVRLAAQEAEAKRKSA